MVPPLSCTLDLRLHQRDHRVRGVLVELERVGAREPEHVARELDHRHLQAEADAEEGDLLLARVAHRGDLALGAAHAEAAGHQHRVHAGEQRLGALRLDLLASRRTCRFTLHVVGDAAVEQRLVEALVALLQVRRTCRRCRSCTSPLRGLVDLLDDVLPALEAGARGSRC